VVLRYNTERSDSGIASSSFFGRVVKNEEEWECEDIVDEQIRKLHLTQQRGDSEVIRRRLTVHEIRLGVERRGEV